MRRNVADRVKAILQELNLSICSDERNKETIHKLLTDHGYKSYKKYSTMKSWYEEFKTQYKKEVLKHFNVELTDDDDLDTKLNQFLRYRHSDVQNPTLGWLMKLFERRMAQNPNKQSLYDLVSYFSNLLMMLSLENVFGTLLTEPIK